MGKRLRGLVSIGSFLSLPFDNSTHNDMLLAVHQLALASAPGHARRPEFYGFCS